MNIVTSTTIAQLSLPQATTAGPSTPLNPTSGLLGSSGANPAGSSQAIAGPSFDATLSAVTKQATTNSPKPEPDQPVSGVQRQSAVPINQTSAGVYPVANSQRDSTSNPISTGQPHKLAAAKPKPDAQAAATVQISNSPTVVDVPITLPVPLPVKNVPSAASGLQTSNKQQASVAAPSASAEAAKPAAVQSASQPCGTVPTIASAPTLPQVSPSAAAPTSPSGPVVIAPNDPTPAAASTKNQFSIQTPPSTQLDPTKAEGLVESAGIEKQLSTGNVVASSATLAQSSAMPPVPVVSTVAAAVTAAAQVVAAPPNVKGASTNPTTNAVAPSPSQVTDATSAAIPALNTELVASLLGQNESTHGLNALDSVASSTSTATASNQAVIVNLMSGANITTSESAAFFGTQQPNTSQGSQKKGDSGGGTSTNLTTPVGSQDATSSISSLVVPLANSPLNSSASNTGSITSQLTDTVMQQIHSQSSGDHSSVVLRLNPPELGQVNVHVSMSNDVVSVRLVASNEATRQLMSGQQNDLRQSLSDQGIALRQFQVDSGGSQSFDQGTSRQSYNDLSSYGVTAPRMTSVSTAVIPQSTSRSLLNYVA